MRTNNGQAHFYWVPLQCLETGDQSNAGVLDEQKPVLNQMPSHIVNDLNYNNNNNKSNN